MNSRIPFRQNETAMKITPAELLSDSAIMAGHLALISPRFAGIIGSHLPPTLLDERHR
jgi:hypothetical protein